MCLYPKLIKNRKYIPNKTNKGNPPPVHDERVRWVPIGCQQCEDCRKQKARSWQVRLLEDIKHNKNGKFITLTFSNERIQYLLKKYPELNKFEPEYIDNAIATLATRKFLERWRKIYGKSLRHWFITELGHKGTENIHIHGIIWTNESLDIVEKTWKNGWVWKGKKHHGQIINYVSAKTINYIIKYVTKIDKDHKTFQSIILTSPGIGQKWETSFNASKKKFQGTKTEEYYQTDTGHKMSLPIYWRNKLYTEDEREKLWLQRLDKNERWIKGIRIDISKGYKEYDRTLKYYQQRNQRLGYGNGEIPWERKQYEKERRQLMYAKRTNSNAPNGAAITEIGANKIILINNQQYELTEYGLKYLA